MIFYRYYTDIPRADVDRFVETQEMCRLVTVGADSTPHVGLYPFLYDGTGVELHCARADEQVDDLKVRPRCVFEVDEVLGTIPSYWVHPEYGGVATAYHRTAIFECVATVIEDPELIADQQRHLLGRYQPEGGFRPVDASDPLYRGSLERLAAIRLTIERCRPLFKLAQNRTPDARHAIIDHLRRRGRANDERAAAAVEWALAREPAGNDATATGAGPASDGARA